MRLLAFIVALAVAPACHREALVGVVSSSEGGGGAGGDGGDERAADLGRAVCEARAACEEPADGCVREAGCLLVLFREELRLTLADCLMTCGTTDACAATARAGAEPPPSFAAFQARCLVVADACVEALEGSDWCASDVRAEDDYRQMQVCLELPCDDVDPCLRGIAYGDDPECFAL